MNPLPNLDFSSRDTLQKAAFVTGALALIVMAAVLWQSGILKNAFGLGAAVVTATDGGLELSASSDTGTVVNPTTLAISTGESVDLDWSATGVTDIPASFVCMGDGVSSCYPNGYAQTLTLAGPDLFSLGSRTFQYNGKWYLLVQERKSLTMYEWLSGQSCWGSGSSCGTIYQSMVEPGSMFFGEDWYLSSLRVIEIGGVPVLATYRDATTWNINCNEYFELNWKKYSVGCSYGTPNRSDFVHMYKWTTQAGCPANGGWGNGSSCGYDNFLQFLLNIDPYGDASHGGGLDFFTVGTNTYLFAGRYVMQWMPPGTPASNTAGCFGDGSTCEYFLTAFPYWVSFADVTTLPSSSLYSALPVAIFEWRLPSGSPGNEHRALAYPWNPSLNSGKGCFGTTGCWAGQFNFSIYSPGSNFWYGPVGYFSTPAGSNGPSSIFTAGGKDYVVIYRWQSVLGTPYDLRQYQWRDECHSGLGGIGSDTTCGAPYTVDVVDIENVLEVKGAYDWEIFGNYFPYSMKIFPASPGEAPTYLGSDKYTVIQNKVLKPTPAACFGANDTCSEALSTLSSSAGSRAIAAFTSGGSDYLVLAASTTSPTPEVYEWMSGSSCFGNGSTCDVALQSMANTTNGFYDISVDTISGSTYLVATPHIGSNTLVYKWLSGSECFGSGSSSCGTPIQSNLPAGRTVTIYDISSTYYLAVADLSGSDSVHIYKWTTSGTGSPCFGTGSSGSCGSVYQDIANGLNIEPRGIEVFTNTSGTSILAVAGNNNSSRIYAWKTSGTGCSGGKWGSTTCNADSTETSGEYLQLVGNDIDAVSWEWVEGISNPVYLVLVSNQAGVGSRIYQWTTTGSGCPSGGGLGSGSSCSVPFQELSPLGVSGSYSSYDEEAVALTDSGNTYLAINSRADNNSGNGSWGATRMWRWMPPGDPPLSNLTGCFGDGFTCDSVSSPTIVQSISRLAQKGSEAHGLETMTISGTPYLVVGSDSGPSTLYTLTAGGETAACVVTAEDTSGGTRAIAATNIGALNTGLLYENTTYTLECGSEGEVSVNVFVGEPGEVPTVSIEATDADANEQGQDPGTFRITRTSSPGGPAACDPSFTDIGGGQCQRTLTTADASPLTVPANWNSADNKVEVIGGGGGGDDGTGAGSGGAGGGAYSSVDDLSLTPSGSATFQVGAGGSSDQNGFDTYFNDFNGTGTVCDSNPTTGQSVCAKGGVQGVTPGGGAGGQASGGVGTTKFSGGGGGTGHGTGDLGGGGGGAAGPNGNGINGSNGTGGVGGNGGAGNAGSGGSGGAGGNGTNGGPGGSGTYSGGGGGGGDDATAGGASGSYGAGGGGGETGGGAGAPGIIVITYTPAATATYPELYVTVTISGTAASNDYEETITTSITIPEDDEFVEIIVTPVDDPESEIPNPEELILTIEDGFLYDAAASPDDSAKINIADNDTAAPPTLTTCNGSEIPPTNNCSFNVIPASVRAGSQTKLYWDVQGLSAANDCYITATPTVVGLPPPWDKVGTSWSNTSGYGVTITKKTIFTLTCTTPSAPAVAEQKTVNILPAFEEI